MKSFLSLIATPAYFEEDNLVRLPGNFYRHLANRVGYRGKAFILCHIIPLQGLYVDKIIPSAVFNKEFEV